MKPLCVDLFCGCFGWSAGWLELGGYVVGFDLEHLPHHGPVPLGADLVIQDVLTLHGSQFREASLILASPPCQEFSYMAMPWSKAKAKRAAILADPAEQKRLTALFDACFRIQREAIEAAGHFIPMVVENVRGANEWVGRSRWNFGSFYLWGDVPALMPTTNRVVKYGSGKSFQTASVEGLKTPAGNCSEPLCKDRPISRLSHPTKEEMDMHGFKTTGHANIRDGHSHTRHLTNQAESDGVKQHKSGRAWFADPDSISGSTTSNTHARKAASAAIAKIPFPLAQHIARYWLPAAKDVSA